MLVSFNRKIITALLVLALVWLGRAAWRGYDQRAAVGIQLNDLESKLASIEQENQFLASASAYFTSDEYLEKQARMKLNYKLPDEQVVIIYPDKSQKAASASVSESDWNFSVWKSWFRKLFK